MDEIAGYFPPVATPPAKAPLRRLEAGRAFGVGSCSPHRTPWTSLQGTINCGTWFLEGFKPSATRRASWKASRGRPGREGIRRGKMRGDARGLGSRVFLMNNVHEDAPEVFETRWCLCYLRGPLTARNQDADGPVRKAREARDPGTAARSPFLMGRRRPPAGQLERRGRGRSFRRTSAALRASRERPGGAALLYRPAILGSAKIQFDDRKAAVSSSERVVC